MDCRKLLASLFMAMLYFVAAPALAAAPGSLISAEPMPGAPDGAAAYRVLYQSLDLSGQPIEVSGRRHRAERPRPARRPAGDRLGASDDRRRPALRALAGAGVLRLRSGSARHAGARLSSSRRRTIRGSALRRSIPISSASARRARSSIRCAPREALPGANASDRFAVWGHSQGGQAALFTGLEAARYSPELKLVGVAAAAPATDLAALMQADLGASGGNNITAMTLWSWSRVYGAPLAEVVAPGGVAAIDRLAGLCIERWFDVFMRRGPSQTLQKDFLTVDNLPQREPWRHLLAENSPAALAPNMPVFLAQGSADHLVPPDDHRGLSQAALPGGRPGGLRARQRRRARFHRARRGWSGGRMDGGALCRRAGAGQLRRSLKDRLYSLCFSFSLGGALATCLCRRAARACVMRASQKPLFASS